LIHSNLIRQKLIGPGTWVGLDSGHRHVIKRMAVLEITKDQRILAVDYTTNSTVSFDPALIVEIDGMALDRFLSQADLNSEGNKITGIKRRGRKPRNRLPL